MVQRAETTVLMCTRSNRTGRALEGLVWPRPRLHQLATAVRRLICLVQVSPVDRLGRRGDVRDDSAEILFQHRLQTTVKILALAGTATL